MDRQRRPASRKVLAGRRVQKLIETVQAGSESARIFKVPSMSEGQYIYLLQFGGRDYYFPTQQEAHKALRDMVRRPPRRKAA